MRFSPICGLPCVFRVGVEAFASLKTRGRTFKREKPGFEFILLRAGYSSHKRFVHHAGYHLIREETNLPAQHVINAIAKVTNAHTREPNKFHRFKPHSSVRYDARTMVLGHDCYAASLTICPKGRLTGQLQMSARMRKQLCTGEPGSAELVYRKGSFYLHMAPRARQD